MNEHRILSESVWYDTVLPSGNLYTKRLLERIVKQFHEDENFREMMLCVPQSKLKENPYLDYTSVAGKIVNLWIDESEQRLMAELLILDTPCGRLIEEAFRKIETEFNTPDVPPTPQPNPVVELENKKAEQDFVIKKEQNQIKREELELKKAAQLTKDLKDK